MSYKRKFTYCFIFIFDSGFVIDGNVAFANNPLTDYIY